MSEIAIYDPSSRLIADTYKKVTGGVTMTEFQADYLMGKYFAQNAGTLGVGEAVATWETDLRGKRWMTIRDRNHQAKPQPMHKMTLFAAMALGQEFTIVKQGVTYSGKITRIELESGFTPPAQPHCFNVTVCDKHSGKVVDVFVRTVD